MSLRQKKSKYLSRGKSKSEAYLRLIREYILYPTDSFINDEDLITDLQNSAQCSKLSKLCNLSEGVYGKTYKLKTEKETLVIKLPYGSSGFDVSEIKLNLEAYHYAKSFRVNPIAEALGYWRSPTLHREFKKRNYAFVYKYESSLSTYADLMRRAHLTSKDFKSLLFQVCLVLQTLQSKMPGFCHNDLHGYNILIVRNPGVTFSYDGAYHRGAYCLKILDFGMAESKSIVTDDADRLWFRTSHNPIVDFLMFCNRTLIYASAAAKKHRYYASWHAEFLRFLERHFHPQCIMNGKGTGAWLHYKYLHIEDSKGIEYVNSTFLNTKPFQALLEDKFFD